MFRPCLRGMAVLLLLWQPVGASAASLVFSGRLIRAGHGSISVKVADGRVIDALLPHTSISAEYKPGDQVQITCKRIEPVWEEDTSRYQSLQLIHLLRLRRPSLNEESKELGSPPGRQDNGVADNKLESARDVNLAYASNMPNFMADETAIRYSSSSNSAKWRYVDTIQTEITFTGNRAVRQRIRKSGKPWERPFQALTGFKWYGGFGTEITPVFDPQCPTTIRYEGRAEVRGKQLLKYRFSSPADGCFVPFYFEYQQYNPARSGHVFIDDPGGNAIQLDEDATEFPTGFEFAQRHEEVSWDYVKIGDVSHLLPVAADFVVLYSSGTRWRVEVEYKNHRHFEASTDIRFP